uniref:Uncharacterized protein n=1 Tax=Mola mola TaxID=94237 RepID=A0A3Q3XA87_MOLML
MQFCAEFRGPQRRIPTHHPHCSKTTEALFGKKKEINLDINAKKRFVLEKKRMNVETFPLTCLIIFPSSPLFTCQRKTMLRYRPGCECKMFPIGFLFTSVCIQMYPISHM